MNEFRFDGYQNPIETLTRGGGTFSPEEILVVFEQLPPDLDKIEKKKYAKQYIRDRVGELLNRKTHAREVEKEALRIKELFIEKIGISIQPKEIEVILRDALAQRH